MRYSVLLCSAWIGLLGAACSSEPVGTGVSLRIRFSKDQSQIERFRLEGFTAEWELFGSVELVRSKPDSNEETVTILFADELAGQSVTIWIWGLLGDEKIAFASVALSPKEHRFLQKVSILGPSPICGDGQFQPSGEFCDLGISSGSGACPQSCAPQQACQQTSLVDQSTCYARCLVTQIEQPIHNDGCCPTGATFDSDNDCTGTCGNGVREPGERCDTLIEPPQYGACPTQCNDANACTKDELIEAGTCQAHCRFDQITQHFGGDGCCLPGSNANLDSDCLPVCGNGISEPGERCDTAIAEDESGACPTDCDDGNPCTRDTLLDGGACHAKCIHTNITQFVAGDGCCPEGGNHILDSDCPVGCGNGVLEPGELCDQGIESGYSGACPVDCDDQIACTLDEVLSPSSCQAQCSNSLITQCGVSDGCCPASCTLVEDMDCEHSCGDGVVDSPTETCDIAIQAPAVGSCPLGCDDGQACTQDHWIGQGTCQAYCSHEQKACVRDDGCCSPGCNNNNDNDCPAECGNGVVEPEGDELCDTQIPQGQPGACPTQSDCDDLESCTQDLLLAANGCQAHCENITITQSIDNDGCCLGGTLFREDSDCPGCGNRIFEAQLGEECDDANQDNLDGCTTSCTKQTGCIGDPCLENEDCKDEFKCAKVFDGGYCFFRPCDLDDPVTTCPSNSVCTKINQNTICLKHCQDDTDCRWAEDYGCYWMGEHKVCVPN